LLGDWKDGRIKLHVTRRALDARRNDPELFEAGSYLPLSATGDRAEHVVSFARRLRRRWAVAASARFPTRLPSTRGFPLGAKAWSDEALVLPRGAPASWRDVFTHEEHEAKGGALPLASVFGRLPVALLVPSDMPGTR
jgi:(1->4)-alpha-D-glucan 1-alpha-D-glucosylmutase